VQVWCKLFASFSAIKKFSSPPFCTITCRKSSILSYQIVLIIVS
jgi:hypothetical protein